MSEIISATGLMRLAFSLAASSLHGASQVIIEKAKAI
ncbi:exported hypothetical protein [Agrobacterium deltaense NCPPB 1641]|uniref:Uncharacterized protein n=1 Tax=Agrobacterium deltaense NCPPB 1641 TaxID=1183425 RepID=A0A1S7UAV1_9HYPH|nr:exported hypothetical protein [Agrobacterium deltaense NCPPB 1641]